MRIRKSVAGPDSYGNLWENDDDVLDIDPEQAAHLLAIPDGGFFIVEDHDVPLSHADAGQGLGDGPDAVKGRRLATREPEGGGIGEGPGGKPVRDVDVREQGRPGGEGKDQGVGPLTRNRADAEGHPGPTDPARSLDPAQSAAGPGQREATVDGEGKPSVRTPSRDTGRK